MPLTRVVSLLKESIINQAFFELPEEKQQTILKAAFAEFGEQGYDRASTNKIVKAAGISKGLLFYYFPRKQELFNTLVSIAVTNNLDRYQSFLDEENPDYLTWMYATAAEKMKAQHERPEETRFLGKVYLSQDSAYLNAEVRESYETMIAKTFEALEKDFDMSLFRDDIPPQLLKNMTVWLFDGYQKQLVSRMEADPACWSEENMKALWNEYYEYLDVMKRLFYKEGNQP